MQRRRWPRVFAPLFLALLLFVSACAPQPPSRFDQAQQASTEKGAPPAVAKDATQGSEFNQFFPAAVDGYERVFTQEKKGFAEAKLKKDGKDMAMLAISDTTSNPAAAKKFEGSADQISGYPAKEVGTTQTALLVGDRYQVKVLSRDPSFTKEQRREWIAKFDLAGLEQLPPARK